MIDVIQTDPNIAPAGTKYASKNLQRVRRKAAAAPTLAYIESTATDLWNPDQHDTLASISRALVLLLQMRRLESVCTMDIIIVFETNDKQARKKDDVTRESSLDELSQHLLAFCRIVNNAKPSHAKTLRLTPPLCSPRQKSAMRAN